MAQSALLQALGYPRAQTFNIADASSFRPLITWLENVKIRQYPVEDRKQLGDFKSSSWRAAFVKYLQDADCPLELAQNDSNLPAVLQWLLNYAISLEYADNAEQYGTTVKQLVDKQQQQQPQQQQQQQAGHHKASKQQPFPDVHNPGVLQHLAELFQLLHVDTGSGNLVDHLQAAKQVLRDSVLPGLTDASVQHAGVASDTLDTSLLGFSTGDPQVDRLATVLRLLYIKDLRHLQTAIDKMVVDMQEFTANPKTDASLGKVGR